MQTYRPVRGLGAFLLTDYRHTDIIRVVMYMTIQQILREKNLSRYQLSKKSGVPWATLADIWLRQDNAFPMQCRNIDEAVLRTGYPDGAAHYADRGETANAWWQAD